MGKREQKRLRAGVVGAGHMGQYHILVYAELWDVDLVGIVDAGRREGRPVSPRSTTRRPHSSHRELFGKVDVVSVAVPTPLHFEVAKECLEAGISVLVEKPLTPTLEEARELFRIARQRNVVLHVGHVERFNGAVQELRKIVANPILVESRRLGPFVPRVQHDTVVMDLMIHDIDIVLGLVDSEVRRITAAGRAGALRAIGRRQRADSLRERHRRQHHRQPRDRAQGPDPRHHPAGRLHLLSTTRTRTSRFTGGRRRSTC